jgi:PAS domain S-box-containing protein
MKNFTNQDQILLEELTDGISTQIWQMIDENTYGYANATHVAFLGKQREDVEHKPMSAFLAHDVAALCVQQNRIVFETKQPVTSDEWVSDSLGKPRLLRIVKSPVFDEKGEVRFLSCAATDITEEHELSEQNRIQTNILEAIARFSKELFSKRPSAIAEGLTTLGEAVMVDRVYYWENHFDSTQQIWLTSQRVEWCAAEITAQIDNPDLQNLPLDAFSEFMEPLQRHSPFIAHVKDLVSAETRDVLAAQEIQSILVLPVFIEHVFMGFVGFDSCLRERDWSEEEVSLLQMFVELLENSILHNKLQTEKQQLHENFDRFFNTVDDLHFILDLEGTILHVNTAVVTKTGYTQSELIGKSVLMLHPPERRAEAAAIVAAMVSGTEDACPVPIMTKDGMQFPVVTHVCQGVWNGKPALFGVSQDTTLLQFSLEKFSKAFENHASMMAIVDTKTGTHIEINERYCSTLGYDRTEVIGKTPFELNLFASDQDAAFAAQVLRDLQSLVNIESVILNKRNQEVYIIQNIAQVHIGTLSCAIVSMLDITERKRMEHELKRYNENLEQIVQDKVRETADALWGAVSSLVYLAESRDDNTGGHLKRLSSSCRLVANALATREPYQSTLTPDFLYSLEQACLLHDIGKVGIPDIILLKPGKLTPEEFEEMKKHTTIGAQTLQQAYPRFQNNSILRMAIDITRSHHERWDGKGYPNGLKGDEIPLSAQIVAICDVYDALRSRRTYKLPFTHEDSLMQIQQECGAHFGSDICEAFFTCEEALREIYDSYKI